jgi:uncharacterized protein
LLGCGGGGDPYIGALMLRQAISRFGPVELRHVDELSDDALMVPVAMMGAPSVMVEKIPSGKEFEASIRALERRLGRTFSAVLCAEIGGINALLPLAVSAALGLPIVDGDGIGRAFPELQMITYNIDGISAAPMSMSDEYCNTVLVEAAQARDVERIGRQVVTAMGGVALICLYAMSGADAKRSMIRGTVSLALQIGRAIREARNCATACVPALVEHLKQTLPGRCCEVLFEGKCTDVSREVRAGWTLGRVTVEGLAGFAGRQLEVQFQNEYLVAREDGRIRAIVPDLIATVDSVTAEPITIDGLRYGQRMAVLGIGAAAELRSAAALAVIGPGAFGLKAPYTPLEALNPYGRRRS